MSYTMYTPLNVWLDPASVTDVVAYIQNYLSENTIYSEEEIEELIHDYLIAHPELIGGVHSVNGKTGTVVLSASDINTANNVTIESVLSSLSSQISSIASSVATNTNNITSLTGRMTTAETDLTNLKSNFNDCSDNSFIEIDKTINWQNGYINTSGLIVSSSASKYAIVPMLSGETVKVGTANSNITIIGTTTEDSLNVGDYVTIIQLTTTSGEFEEYTYRALTDIKIVICVKFSDYKLTFFTDSNFSKTVREYSLCKNLVGQDTTKYYPVYIPANTKFTMSTADGQVVGTQGIRLIAYNINKEDISDNGWNFNPSFTKRTVSLSSDIYYLRWHTVIPNRPFQVEIGENATPYQKYFPNSNVIDRYEFEYPINDNTLRENTFNASYHTGAKDFATKCKEFSSLLLGDTINNVVAPSDFESFLFFTDPHLLEGSSWQDQCYEFIAQIQKYYNSTPTTFCLCGGDWLGNSDLPAEACFKMGYIDGFMHSMFNECYMLVGNHDTNYQGKKDSASATYTTRLSNQSIVDLWYREGKKAYFTFNGANTKFYCFDAGTEGQQLATFDDYGWEQAQWFASGLANETSEHIAIATHILYSSGTEMQPLTEQILTIAEAYNSRTAVSVNGTSYNFNSATGKVEFLIAGHNHADGFETIQGIPCIRTINVQADVSIGASFDLVFVNYDNREIKLIRVGSGNNRTVSLSA